MHILILNKTDMKNLLSAALLAVVFCSMSFNAVAQMAGNDSSKKSANLNLSDPNNDSLIKAKLVGLAANNPDLKIADANVKIAQYNYDVAKNSWLGSLNVSSNVNEFVVNGTYINGVAASTYYPKYNVGLSVPLDIFSKTKGAKRVGSENIVIAKAMKDDRLRLIKQEVLTRYENYKLQKEVNRLQKILTEEDNDFYVAAQKSYADGTIQLIDMNKTYQTYIIAQSRMASCQHDLNIAVIQLEEMIGMPLDQALSNTAPDTVTYGQ